MRTFEIPQDQWPMFFDNFSKDHFNWQTTIEVLEDDLGDQPEVEGAALQGISIDPAGSAAGDIEIALGDTPDSFQTHRIQRPTNVRVVETLPGEEMDMEIESAEGAQVIVHLRPYPPLPPQA